MSNVFHAEDMRDVDHPVIDGWTVNHRSSLVRTARIDGMEYWIAMKRELF